MLKEIAGYSYYIVGDQNKNNGNIMHECDTPEDYIKYHHKY
jgi:hypothetical protein